LVERKPAARSSVVETFAARAAGYSGESPWVSDKALIDPLLLLGPKQKDGLLADVCAGTGVVAERAVELGWRAIVVDLVPEMLFSLRNNSRRAILADAEQLPLGADSVNRAVIRQGLQYVSVVDVLAELCRVAPVVSLGHIVALTERDVPTWRRYFSYASPGRRHVFVKGRMADDLEQAGLHIVSTQLRRANARLGDSIRHLGTEDRLNAVEAISVASDDFKERNGFDGGVNEQSEYSLIWEFIVAVRAGEP
jgi:SAM-dependent methyltransferase